ATEVGQVTITVDANGQPAVTITSPANGGFATEADPVTLTGSATDEDGDLSASLEWSSSLDGPLGTGASVVTAALSVGSHTLTASVTDSLGATGSASVTFTVAANTPPNVTVTAPADASVFHETVSVTFTGTALDTEDDDISTSLAWSSSVDGALASGSTFSTDALSVGLHTITASVTDSHGATGSASINLTIEADQVPVVTILDPPDGSTEVEGNLLFLQGNAEDAEDGNLAFQIQWSSSIDGALGSGDYIATPSLSVGTHTITASVTDSFGNVGSVQITVTILPNTPPSVAITSPADGTSAIETDAITFTAAASDAQEGDLGFLVSWQSSLDGALFTGPSFTTTTLSVGSHTITARVADSVGAEATSSITVVVSANTPPAATISSPASGTTVTEGTALTFTGSAPDAEEGDLGSSLAWTSSLDGAIGAGAGFSLSTLSIGSHTITASVTDSYGAQGSAQISLAVLANQPPSVTLTAPGDGTEITLGDTLNLAAAALDPENGDLSAAVVWSSDLDGALGTGASISASSLSRGTHLITATITDSHGAQAQDTVSVVVLSAPVTLTFESIGNEDGWVRESNESSEVGGAIKAAAGGNNSLDEAIRIGDNKKDRQFRSILSFDTSPLPEGAVIDRVTVRVLRGRLVGQNPIPTHGPFLVDVKSGGFSGSTSLETSDFQATADVVAAASMSNPAADLDWSEGDLDAAGRAAINTLGTTQLRLRLAIDDNDDRGKDMLGFYPGESADPALRPVIEVTYREY
ncbi:MAG: hypothetical protein MI919_06905, partial [Holophagales bacterium]|nr:hypothetical protein [Holophagales bacterium]